MPKQLVASKYTEQKICRKLNTKSVNTSRGLQRLRILNIILELILKLDIPLCFRIIT